VKILCQGKRGIGRRITIKRGDRGWRREKNEGKSQER